MKDKKRTEILLKVIEKVCMKNPETQKLIDKSIINKEEDVSSKQVLFFFISCWIYRHGLSKHKCFVCEGWLMKILGFIFSGNQGKNHAKIFDAGILRM